MLVARKCMLTNKVNTLNLNISQSQLDRIDNRYATGEYIPVSYTHLTLPTICSV